MTTTTLAIPYNDLGKLAYDWEYANSNQWQSITTLANAIVASLNSAIRVDSGTSYVPKSNTVQPVFVDNSNFTSFTYRPNSGEYAVGNIRLLFNTISNDGDISFNIRVDFFDLYRVTVTMVEAPSVSVRLDTSNIDQSMLNMFVMGVLSVGYLAILDKTPNQESNNVPSNG